MKFGDIVGVHGGRISKETVGAERLLVVSFKPIVLGNMPNPGREKESEKVAFMGQVPVKVIGVVQRGDYIVASGAGDGIGRVVAADAMTPALLDQVVGVAWGESRLSTLKFVNVAVGLRPGDIVSVVKSQEKRLRDLETKLAAAAATVARVEQLEARMNRLAATVAARSEPAAVVRVTSEE